LNTMLGNDVRQMLDQFRRNVDQMFENVYSYQTQPPAAGTPGERNWTFSPALESGWNDTFLNLRAVVPGVHEKDLRVSVQNNQLVIEGERKAPQGFEKSAYTHLAYGKFYTALTLPAGLDVDHINCKLHDGVLDLQVPIKEAAKPKQIQIQTTEKRAIGA